MTPYSEYQIPALQPDNLKRDYVRAWIENKVKNNEQPTEAEIMAQIAAVPDAVVADWKIRCYSAVASKEAQPSAEPEMVDLGITDDQGNKVLWAKCNIGANSETEYGKYFAWGETVGYTDATTKKFSYADYAMTSGTVSNLTRNATLDEGGYYAYSNDTETYYFDEEEVGDETWAFEKQGEDNFVVVAGKIFENGGTYYFNKMLHITTLDAAHDAASVAYGSAYCMPTEDDFIKLKNGTTNSWTANYNDTGVAGYVFTGNNNTLFIPAAGYYNGDSYTDSNKIGCIWTSNIDAELYIAERCSFARLNKLSLGTDYRCNGLSVRAIKRQA